jgi:hypothetical protein
MMKRLDGKRMGVKNQRRVSRWAENERERERERERRQRKSTETIVTQTLKHPAHAHQKNLGHLVARKDETNVLQKLQI